MSIISNKQSTARDLKQRTLTCLNKLSDRDTHSSAASELHAIAISLSPDTLPPFLSSISATDSSDKSPVRRTCLHLISTLSAHHATTLSPHLSKLLSSISRRLRDPDSSVRSACVSASHSLSSNLTSTPFLSIAKPFIESLFTEQEFNAQCGAAMCLVAVIEGCRCPDVGTLRRVLGRVEKLAKCDGFKAKSAILGVIGSVVGVEGVLSGRGNVIREVVDCLVSFLSSDDWAARKAAAEALIKVVEVEKEALMECKAACLVTFEAKKFDKVKAAREAMSQMIDAWKEIPDVLVEPCKENGSDGRNLPVPRNSSGSLTTTIKKRNPLENSTNSTPSADVPAATARRRSLVSGNENKKGTAMFRKLDRKKPSESKVDGPVASSKAAIPERDTLAGDDRDFETQTVEKIQMQPVKPGIRRALFNGNGACVVPCTEASVCTTNESGDTVGSLGTNQRESEDLSVIHKQLVHIENQQANLFDLLQKYIGSSQNSMLSLESRVHGLELTLEEISFDLAAKGRMSQDTAAAMCCKLPGSDFLSSKFRKRAECRPHLLASSEMPPATEFHSSPNRGTESLPLNNQRNRLQASRGLVTNPLAEIPRASSRRVVNNTSA